MKNLFLPYELALLAKEKGFNVDCFTFYSVKHIENNGRLFFDIEPDDHELTSLNQNRFVNYRISAPLYQQMLEWLREKYNLHIIIIPLGSQWKKEIITMYDVYVNKNYIHADINLDSKGNVVPEFDNYYDALNKGIHLALESIKM